MRDGSTDRKGLSQRAQNLTEGQGKNKEDLGRKPGLRSHKGLRSTMLGRETRLRGGKGDRETQRDHRETQRLFSTFACPEPPVHRANPT